MPEFDYRNLTSETPDDYYERMKRIYDEQKRILEEIKEKKKLSIIPDENGFITCWDTKKKMLPDDVSYPVYDQNDDVILYLEHCPECGDDYRFCQISEECYPRDIMVYVQNVGTVRSRIVEDGDFFHCDDCCCWYEDTYYGEDGLCDGCLSQRRDSRGDIEDYYRDFNTGIVTSSQVGDIVKHKKVFGV